MARIHTSTARKEDKKCGKCGKTIAKGEKFFWSMPGFRSSWKSRKVRCLDHPFKPSDLTTSLKGDALAAIEAAQEDLGGLDPRAVEEPDEVSSILDTARETIDEVAQAYGEAAENFGGGGPNGEARDEMEAAAGELDVSLDPFDGEGCEEHNTPERDAAEMGIFDPDCDDCLDIRQEWAQGLIDEADSALANVSI